MALIERRRRHHDDSDQEASLCPCSASAGRAPSRWNEPAPPGASSSYVRNDRLSMGSVSVTRRRRDQRRCVADGHWTQCASSEFRHHRSLMPFDSKRLGRVQGWCYFGRRRHFRSTRTRGRAFGTCLNAGRSLLTSPVLRQHAGYSRVVTWACHRMTRLVAVHVRLGSIICQGTR